MRSPRRRRAWCELARADELVRSGVLPALATRGVSLLFAVSPGEERDALEVVRACRSAQLRVGLWPLLPRERGRWANELTACDLAPFAESLYETLAREQALPDELAIDLEPPFDLLSRRDIKSAWDFVRAPRNGGSARIEAWATHARSQGIEVVAAALPIVLADDPTARLQRVLAIPLAPLGSVHVSVMMYSSLLEGYSRRVLRRPDTRALLFEAARRAASRENFGLSLGAIGKGSLGDEAVYRSPDELSDDVALAQAAGVRDLALFSLCGALRRGNALTWLEAFTTDRRASEPPTSRRARLAWMALDCAGR